MGLTGNLKNLTTGGHARFAYIHSHLTQIVTMVTDEEKGWYRETHWERQTYNEVLDREPLTEGGGGRDTHN